MNSPASPFRRSIWVHDERYDLNQSWTKEQLATISRLAAVDAAKKRIPPIGPRDLLKIEELARTMPASADVQVADVERFLNEVSQIRCAGVITAICMLSVLTDGDYAPIDRKVAKGLLSKGKISATERSELLDARNPHRFSKVYIHSVLPAWRESLSNRTPRMADDYWGAAG